MCGCARVRACVRVYTCVSARACERVHVSAARVRVCVRVSMSVSVSAHVNVLSETVSVLSAHRYVGHFRPLRQFRRSPGRCQ